MEDLQRCLQVTADELDTHGLLASTRELLHGSFTVSPQRLGFRDIHLQEITLEELEKQSQYISWKESPKSSLLVLSGYNFSTYNKGYGLCWLSPAALQVAAAFSSNPIAFYTARSGTRSPKRSARGALSSTLLQLLNADRELCADRYEYVKREVSDAQGQSLTISACAECLTNVISASGRTPIYILLDRVELFYDIEIKDFLFELRDIVRQATKTVKILVIADSLEWKDEENRAAKFGSRYLQCRPEENILFLKLQCQQAQKS